MGMGNGRGMGMGNGRGMGNSRGMGIGIGNSMGNGISKGAGGGMGVGMFGEGGAAWLGSPGRLGAPGGGAMTDKQFLEREIRAWKASAARKRQLEGAAYYEGRHDVLKRKRTVIGEGGKLKEVGNLPNNRIVDNQYAKMVDQKTNYLFGKRLTFSAEDGAFEAALAKVFDRRFHRLLQNLAESSLNGGISWLHVYYDGEGRLRFKRFEPHEALPFWKDQEHTELELFVRVYEVEAYEGRERRAVEKVEVYGPGGVARYELRGGELHEDAGAPSGCYVTASAAGSGAGAGAGVGTGAGGGNGAGTGGGNGGNGEAKGYNWERLPVIAFKYNDKETPLITKVKPLQDGINDTLSGFMDNMQEDSRNTILIIKNYDGENLAEFRHNLAAFGAVKVRTVDGADGGVEALRVEVDSGNYKALLELLKKALVENAMGYDARDDRMSGSPNQMNILSMYSDADLDANGMEAEYQAAFEELLWFVVAHLANTGQGDFEGEDVEIIFNRDMLMNESDIVANVRDSAGILSNETLVANHPWVNDVALELERIDAEAKADREGADAYAGAFPPMGASGAAGPMGATGTTGAGGAEAKAGAPT